MMMNPDMQAENIRTLRNRGLSEPDAIRQAVSPSSAPRPMPRMGMPPGGVGVGGMAQRPPPIQPGPPPQLQTPPPTAGPPQGPAPPRPMPGVPGTTPPPPGPPPPQAGAGAPRPPMMPGAGGPAPPVPPAGQPAPAPQWPSMEQMLMLRQRGPQTMGR